MPHLQAVGFSGALAATAMSVVGLGSAIGKFSFGWLCDFIPPKYILVIGSALEAAGTIILVGITPTSPLFIVWLYAAMFGLGVGSWLPAVSMNTSVNFGLKAYGAVFSFYNMLFMLTNGVSPLIGGYIFDMTGSYYLAFQLCFILYAISIPCMLLVRQSKRRKK